MVWELMGITKWGCVVTQHCPPRQLMSSETAKLCVEMCHGLWACLRMCVCPVKMLPHQSFADWLSVEFRGVMQWCLPVLLWTAGQGIPEVGH